MPKLLDGILICKNLHQFASFNPVGDWFKSLIAKKIPSWWFSYSIHYYPKILNKSGPNWWKITFWVSVFRALENWKEKRRREEEKTFNMILDDKKVAWPFTWKKSTGCFNIFSLCVNVIFSSYLQSLQHEARITKRLTLFFVSQTHASTTLVIVFKWTEVIDRQEFLVWLQTLWSIDYYWNWTFLYTDFL